MGTGRERRGGKKPQPQLQKPGTVVRQADPRKPGHNLVPHRSKSLKAKHLYVQRNLVEEGWPAGTANTDPRSLTNHGNRCHRNAMLQSLLHISDFVNFLNLGHDHCAEDKGCVLCMLIQLSFRYWTCRKESKRGDFDYVFNNFCEAFDRWYIARASSEEDRTRREEQTSAQQDSSETLLRLLNAIESVGAASSTSEGPHNTRSAANKPASYKKLIDELFKIEYDLTQISSCGHVKKADPEEHKIWSLPVITSKYERAKIEEYIEQYFRPEIVHGWRCEAQERCDGELRKTRRKIKQAPRILSIVLNRYDKEGRKLKTVVQYPETLDLTKHTADGYKLRYRLQAVVCHAGTDLASGHYFAIVREQNGRVSVCSDREIIRLGETRAEQVLLEPHIGFTSPGVVWEQTGDAYVLYYVRASKKY